MKTATSKNGTLLFLEMAKSIKPAIAAYSTKINSSTMKKTILIALAAATTMITCQPAAPVAPLAVYDGPNRPEWAASDNIYEVNVRQYTEEGTL